MELLGPEVELADQVDRAAAGLAALGVGPGDRVAIVLPNCPQHVVAFYAVLRLGAVVAVGCAFVLRGPGGGRSGSAAAQGALFTEIARP